MKRLLSLISAVLLVFALAACSTDTEEEQSSEVLSTQESLVSLAYLSGGMLDTAGSNTQNMSFRVNDTEFESEIEQVNIYMDQLKAFIENGTKDFADVTEEVSDRVEYEFKLTFVVNEEVYILYYNGSEVIEGILIIEDVTYTINGENDLKDAVKDEAELQEKLLELQAELEVLLETVTEDDEEQEELDEDIADLEEKIADLEEKIADDAVDNEDEEQETKMKLIATNGDDSIEIEYKVEDKEDESTTKFEIKSDVNGVYSEKEMKIVQEENHYKVSVKEGEDEYTFKRNVEDDGVVYKLEYRINGERGQVMIHEEVDEFGEVTYRYKVPGSNDIVKGKPESKGRDRDDDDEPEDDEAI